MALFDYQAANAQGRIEKGQLDADSARGVRQQLRGRGLTPVQVSAARSAGSRWGARRLSASELAWATRQLASLLAASLPLESALSAVIEQAVTILEGVIARLR